VYAYGIIMWEIFTQKEPFFQFEFHSERESAIIDGERPTITEEIPIHYGNLMRLV
jgi:hypothetical protein